LAGCFGRQPSGLKDNFFELGGHSLLAMKLVGHLRQKLKIDIVIRAVFESPVMAAFAEQLSLLMRQTDEPSHSLSYRAMTKVSSDEPLLASYAQQRLWLIDQIDGGSAHYNIPDGFTLTGELNFAALKRAFATIIERHESLRTRFFQNNDDKLIQAIQTGDDFYIALTNLSKLTGEQLDSAVAQAVCEEAERVFDLSQDLMIRAGLIKVAPKRHVLLVTMHHIAADGWSMYLLVNELSVLYQAFAKGLDNPLPALDIQYSDYAHWQRNWLDGLVLSRQMDYWTTQLAGLPIAHNLPLDKPRSRNKLPRSKLSRLGSPPTSWERGILFS
jgi:hypothetical protein